ncbi:cysteine desulfurase NifS [Anaerovoracaceae bacterium 41-7]|uniref:Cysteine desulfurase IscS n=2 Tax=Oscillospiraceae TaxID=216572 RepID=A0A845QJ21_9FIRM|nr:MULTISPECIES: cysteine desulfurase NifS [Eubacteriales]NBH61101.1 cysteine desulfurase NifS [Anaerotruncus colihominis]NCF01756.1 cysteine desulfurase NifS [Anaerotruncus sp. 80]
MRQVYLDYSATTPVKEEVLQEMIPYFTEQFGNPSSLYTMGLTSKEAVDKARSQVAALIGADSKEIYFTGCGSEADNWAVFGTVDKFKEKGNHIITTRIEHHAMLHSCEFLEKNGYKVTYLEVEPDGTVKPENLEAAITDQTILISIMMVNNEVGTIEPIKELAAIAKKHGILFHTDAVQALANVPIDVKDLGVDMLSVSAHKIYGPKGIGALYIRKGLRISNYMHGGAQEMGRRAGTENLAGIVGFGKAAELAKINMEEHIAHCSQLRDYLIDRITREIPDTFVNGTMEHRHPGNANITFKYIEGESILLLLDYKGVSVSTGSACSSKSLEPSHVLTALGVPVEMVHGTVRFTVGDFTTKEDIDYTVESLNEIVEKLRALSPVNSEKGW